MPFITFYFNSNRTKTYPSSKYFCATSNWPHFKALIHKAARISAISYSVFAIVNACSYSRQKFYIFRLKNMNKKNKKNTI